jgi:hypothetical protein
MSKEEKKIPPVSSRYVVIVADNFHYMEKDAEYQIATFNLVFLILPRARGRAASQSYVQFLALFFRLPIGPHDE